MWAIIAGSGFEKFSELRLIEELPHNTPFGQVSLGARRIKLADEEVVFIPRHGKYHKISPSEINYRANIFLLKKLNVTKILSISSVGSLRDDLKPGDLVVPSQYIDHTKGLRPHTFGGNGIVGHVSLAEPVTMGLVNELRKYQPQFNFAMHFDRVYLTIEGPAYSTRAEARYYRSMGADVIGMTGFPEYALAREAGICYLACCFVTDYDCWQEGCTFVTTDKIIAILEKNRCKGIELAKRFIPATSTFYQRGCKELSIGRGLLTDRPRLNAKQLELLRILD